MSINQLRFSVGCDLQFIIGLVPNFFLNTFIRSLKLSNFEFSLIKALSNFGEISPSEHKSESLSLILEVINKIGSF